PFQMVLAKSALDPAPDDFLLEQNHQETDRAKKDNDATGRLLAGQERNQDDNNGRPGARPEKLPDRLAPGGEQGAVIKALHRQQHRRDRDNDRNHPGIFPEGLYFRALPEKPEFPDRAQLVRHPESQGEQTRVRQFVNPDANLSLATQHGFGYLAEKKRFGKSKKTRPEQHAVPRTLFTVPPPTTGQLLPRDRRRVETLARRR